jgi:hypothetical protein
MVLCSVALWGQQPEVQARVKELESNQEYMSLLRQEQEYKRINDSIQKRVGEYRQLFRTDTVNRAQRAVEILEIEEKLFDLRDRLGELTNQINIIEQEWILQHLNESVAEAPADSTIVAPKEEIAEVADSLIAVVEDTTRTNLLDNYIFESNIDADVLAQIREGQTIEMRLEDDARNYLRNHNKLIELKNSHSMADSASLATALFEEFVAVQEENLELESTIADDWATIFDNKTYAYNILLDKEGHYALRDSFNLHLNDIAARVADSDVPSSALFNYALQRRALTEYEVDIARTLGLGKAVDSLSAQINQPRHNAILGMSKIGQISERVFLNYEDITIHSPAIYNSRNPIPECEIYPKGTIYRILLGSFSTEQSPSIFRGAAPLFVQHIYGKYRYFAGGFASDSTAFAAQEQCRKIGFRKPEVVVWVDGQYFNLSEDMESDSENHKYRIVIESEEPLSEEHISEIKSAAVGSDIIKIGNNYTISNIDGYLNALRLKESIEATIKLPARIEETN